ncbi:hypothetical protein C8R47DRAFT_93645 [Mycena vitilis]|nr:hypothetical protein C8R47DRAFT_93645 [Mycena vitilis]
MSYGETEALFSAISGGGKRMDTTAMPGLEERIVPEDLAKSGARHECYNFALFHHYMANPAFGHLPPSPLIQSMKRHQKELFLYLRRANSEVSIPPAWDIPDLSAFPTDLDVAWWVLYHAGALEFRALTSDGRWVLESTRNALVRAELVDGLPALVGSSADTDLEAVLRALSAGRPEPFTDTISTLLAHTPMSELSSASEATLQTIINTHIKQGKKVHNYFSQLRLLTNKDIEEKDDEQKRSEFKGEQSDVVAKPAPGAGRYGRADCVLCGLNELGLRIFILIELKYVSLESLLRAEIANGVVTAPETLAAKTNMLKELNKKICHLSPVDLGEQKYHRWDNDTNGYIEATVGALASSGADQVGFYRRAIKNGRGHANGAPRDHSNGVLDWRMLIDHGSDVILSIVILGIGSRVIAEQCDSERTSWRYFGNSGYKLELISGGV